VTRHRSAPFSARHLALALVETRAIDIASAAPACLRAITGRSTRGAAHPLGRHR
jgi:hypothetical protein